MRKFSMILEKEFEEMDGIALVNVNGGASVGGGCTGSVRSRTGYGMNGGGSYGGSSGSGSGSSSSVSSGGCIGGGNAGITGSGSGSGGGSNPSPSYSSGGCIKLNAEKPNPIPYQKAYDESDYHCDIIAFNNALDNGVENPGTWDGNSKTVDQIYNEYYSDQGTENSVEPNSKGYIFYDFERDGKYDHMEYYEAGSNGSYTVWQTKGKEEAVQVTYDSATDSNAKAGTGIALFTGL